MVPGTGNSMPEGPEASFQLREDSIAGDMNFMMDSGGRSNWDDGGPVNHAVDTTFPILTALGSL